MALVGEDLIDHVEAPPGRSAEDAQTPTQAWLCTDGPTSPWARLGCVAVAAMAKPSAKGEKRLRTAPVMA
jgi:hypothetical protein